MDALSPRVDSEARIQLRVGDWGSEPKKGGERINLALWRMVELWTPGAQSPRKHEMWGSTLFPWVG